MLTAEQIAQLALRIQSENELEATKLLFEALKDSFFEGFESASNAAQNGIIESLKQNLNP